MKGNAGEQTTLSIFFPNKILLTGQAIITWIQWSNNAAQTHCVRQHFSSGSNELYSPIQRCKGDRWLGNADTSLDN